MSLPNRRTTPSSKGDIRPKLKHFTTNIIAQEFVFKYEVEEDHQADVSCYLEHLFLLLVYMEVEGWNAKKISAFLSVVKKIEKIDTSYDALRDYANILLN